MCTVGIEIGDVDIRRAVVVDVMTAASEKAAETRSSGWGNERVDQIAGFAVV